MLLPFFPRGRNKFRETSSVQISEKSIFWEYFKEIWYQTLHQNTINCTFKKIREACILSTPRISRLPLSSDKL